MTSLRSRILHSTLQWVIGALVTHLSLQAQRTGIDELAHRLIHLSEGVTADIVPADGVRAEWIEPAGIGPQKVFLYLHGGGQRLCSIDTHRGLAARLALACRSRVLIIAYCLAPDNPFPAALEDALSAYHWLIQQGISPRPIPIAGDSAGGGLTFYTTVKLRDLGEHLSATFFLLSPWADLTFSGESIRTRKGVDPIFGHDDDTLEITPVYLRAENDEIPLDHSTRLEKKLNAAGVYAQLDAWKDMWSVFQVFAPFAPESQLAIDEIGIFFCRQIH